jgi:hypothetical protein
MGDKLANELAVATDHAISQNGNILSVVLNFIEALENNMVRYQILREKIWSRELCFTL